MRHLAGEVNATIYELEGGWRAAAGKTDRDNDLLSLRYAGQEDWWFHVNGLPGSHVILYHEEGKEGEPGRKLLEEAAAIAAWHSKSRGAGVVAVHCTQARHVSKPKGAKPGSVCIKKERTLKVRPAIPTP
ncbi:MAG: NFACT RNA binding domain-containing protein [Kiritimatiellae bacterium]|nr:NFACT RNA binding domain-containing protein [Kiritimatiellia bacterium]